MVFEAAVDKARALTGAHIELPHDENFSIEFILSTVLSLSLLKAVLIPFRVSI
ncbi:conserved protein of unknown function [Shewanella benthica]|uniref:Uncharacterized protein n=1 Tax=Shewanella benthica TaxID=43661 RepID=A0A330M095_9GAMM|nr:conserved protein of unknown function [Shewanella benthica]